MSGAQLAIEIRGLAVHAHHGVHEHEKRDGQPFLIDVRAVPRSALACRTDSLADAVSYAELATLVATIAVRERFDLIERLASFLCDALLAAFPLEHVGVTVHKPEAPIGLPFDDVCVTVARSASTTCG